MTLDETIKWELETAEHSTILMYKYHTQVAEFLKELKALKDSLYIADSKKGKK